MKRLYFFLALLLLAFFAGCKTTDTYDEMDRPGSFGVSTWQRDEYSNTGKDYPIDYQDYQDRKEKRNKN